MKLNIFYMHYDTDNKCIYKDRPAWFSFESCLRNIIKTIALGPSDVQIRFFLMFDGDRTSFANNFCSKYFPQDTPKYTENCEYRTILFDAGSAAKSAALTLNHISEMQFQLDTLIYILENDYLHTNDWIKNIRDIYHSNVQFDYLSLYDHADKYEFSAGFDRRYISLKSKIYTAGQLHWRTNKSTCFSFLTRPHTLKLDAWVFKNYPDHKAFLILLYLKSRVLLTALPGQSTHCMSKYLSPTIDWEKVSIDGNPSGFGLFY